MVSIQLLTNQPVNDVAPLAASRLPTQARQAALVAAVFSLACERSPAHITTGDIAAALGVTQGALFKHFASKEAIWLAAAQWVHAQLMDRLEGALQSAPARASPVAALGAMFHAHVDFVTEHPGVPRVIFQELQQPGDSPAKLEVRRLLQRYRQLLMQCLATAVAAGEVAADLDQDAAATLFIGIVQGLVMQSLISGQPAQMPAHAGRVFTLYLRGLRDPS
jgi:TetR/AcrR family transcriptional regulator